MFTVMRLLTLKQNNHMPYITREQANSYRKVLKKKYLEAVRLKRLESAKIIKDLLDKLK